MTPKPFGVQENSPTDNDDEATALHRRFVAFGNALRHHGLVVGTSDVIDAAAIAQVLGFDERERLREGLASAFMRRGEQRGVFDELFDLYFPAAVGARLPVFHAEAGSAAETDNNFDPATADATAIRERARELTEALAHALATNDEDSLNALAATAVVEFGALNRPGEEGFSSNQAIEQFQPNLAIARASEIMREGPESRGSDGGTAGGSSGGGGSAGSGLHGTPSGWEPEPFTQRFDRDVIRGRVAAFRRRIETEARRRNAELRGVERLAQYAVRTPLERRDFAQTYTADAAELRRIIDPLAKRLAARMAAKRRRASHGSVDVRKTIRASMATGGVPIKPAYANRPPAKADLVLLCDMSSSVAGFSRFAILLMQAMHAQFGRVRVFGFVNTVDELTQVVRDVGRDGDLVEALRGNTRMTRGHRNSDYGTTFVDFLAQHDDSLTPRSTVMILGDARSNNTNPQYDALREIVAGARHAVWLNPESESQWGQGDSVAHRYADIIDMHECRTVTDLREFVSRTF